MTSRPEQLSEAIDHLRGAEDVILEAGEHELRVRNVRSEVVDGDDAAAGAGAMMSETVVRADHFEAYTVSSGAPMELCVREVKVRCPALRRPAPLLAHNCCGARARHSWASAGPSRWLWARWRCISAAVGPPCF